MTVPGGVGHRVSSPFFANSDSFMIVSSSASRSSLRLLQFFVAGFASLAYQVVSFKLIAIAGLGDALSVAISLTGFVSLSGFGALLAGRVPSRLAGWWEVGLGVYALAIFATLWLAGIEPVVALSGGLAIAGKLALFLALTAPLAFLSGMLIPLHQYRQSRFAPGKPDADFLSFLPVYVFFHIGGALSLLLIELYGFPAFGWPLMGTVIGALSLLNGVSVLRQTPVPVVPRPAHPGPGGTAAVSSLLWVLLGLSVITGYAGIVSYKAFDYLVGPNIRNYTVVTALIFVGLSLSGPLARRLDLTLRGILGLTGLGIGCLFLPVVAIPALAVEVLDAQWSHWWIYAAAGVLLIVPAYTLMGVSVPAAVRLGVRSEWALFVVSIGNALGYWLYILTAHHNVDAVVLASAAVGLLLLGSVRIWLVAFPLAGLFATPIVSVAHPALHHMILDSRLTQTFAFMQAEPIPMSRPGQEPVNGVVYFKIVQSWNTYGWSVDHVRVNEWATDAKEVLLESEDKLVIGGFTSLSMQVPERVMFAEAAAAGLPSLFAPRREQALVLGAGTGVSAGMVATHFGTTDLVDLSPDTPDHLAYFEPLNGGVVDRASLIRQDALAFLRDRTANQTATNGYDLIFSTVTGAGYPFSAMLYTDTFYRQVAANLAPDGVFAFWVDSRLPWGTGLGSVLNAVQAHLPYLAQYRVWPTPAMESGEVVAVPTDSNDPVPYHVIIASRSPLAVGAASAPILDELKRRYESVSAVDDRSELNGYGVGAASNTLARHHKLSPHLVARGEQSERQAPLANTATMPQSYAYDLHYAHLASGVQSLRAVVAESKQASTFSSGDRVTDGTTVYVLNENGEWVKE
ncbi:MAG: Uncharacterized protein AWU57_27 [Marinobacter sp. T13-3]|nr:MAG: Uncharacterized protein AWU57_27 [Marinobacter sp. T13-3]